MNKRAKESYVSVTVSAIMARDAAERSPRGSLAEKHAWKIARRYARRSMAMYRWTLVKPFLVVAGVIGLIAIVVSNWPG